MSDAKVGSQSVSGGSLVRTCLSLARSQGVMPLYGLGQYYLNRFNAAGESSRFYNSKIF
jgi:hypothetical protein